MTKKNIPNKSEIKTIEIMKYSALTINALLGILTFIFYDTLIELPWVIKTLVAFTGGMMYFTGEGKCQGFTFVADHYAFYQTEVYNISQIRYKLARGIESIGIAIIGCTLAVVAQRQHFIYSALAIAPTYFMYPFMLKRMWSNK